MTKVYRSKIGLELVVPVTLVLLPIMTFAVYDNATGFGTLVTFLVSAFIADMFMRTHYTIDGDLLKIKCGFLYSKQIEISKIKRISETNNALSAPAISLDRLEITYNKFDDILISPKKKQEFISDIRNINPGIEVNLKVKSNL